jgi:hypothetical protein
MIEIGWGQKIYPAAKIAIVVDALAAEGVPVADALRRTHFRRAICDRQPLRSR